MSDVKEKLNKIAEFAKTIYKGDDAHFFITAFDMEEGGTVTTIQHPDMLVGVPELVIKSEYPLS